MESKEELTEEEQERGARLKIWLDYNEIFSMGISDILKTKLESFPVRLHHRLHQMEIALLAVQEGLELEKSKSSYKDDLIDKSFHFLSANPRYGEKIGSVSDRVTLLRETIDEMDGDVQKALSKLNAHSEIKGWKEHSPDPCSPTTIVPVLTLEEKTALRDYLLWMVGCRFHLKSCVDGTFDAYPIQGGEKWNP